MARFNLKSYLETKSFAGLKVRGDKLNSCCPFHVDSSPSFGVNLITGAWLCRTPPAICGMRGSSAASLVAKLEGISFREACEMVGSAYRAPLETDEDLRRLMGHQPKVVGAPKVVPLPLCSDAADHPYLLGRRVDDTTAQAFGLQVGKDRTSWADYLLLPVYAKSESGEFEYLTFTARYMKAPDAQHPRYTGPVFPLKNFLYGEWQFRESDSPVYIVEGQFDVMRLWAFGEVALGTFGTGFTPAQAQRIAQFVGRQPIVVLFDADTMNNDIRDTQSKPMTFVSTLSALGKKARLINVAAFSVKDADQFTTDTWRDARTEILRAI